ncbi:MAG: hypothetical protein ACO23R_14210 [bacterium]
MQFWWETGVDDCHDELMGVINELNSNHYDRMIANLDYLKVYSQRRYDLQDFRQGVVKTASYALDKRDDMRMRLNVTQSMIDTITSKIGKNRPRPMYLTEGGDYSLRTKAKMMGRMMEGLFLQSKLYDIMPKIFQDSCIFDLGVLKIYAENGKIYVERVFANEILWDMDDALYGEPQSLYQVKKVHKSYLLDRFSGFSSEINNLLGGKQEENPDSELIECVEAWHLPTSPESGDGRHVICIEGVTLLDEEYTRTQFPFLFLKWSDSIVGFGGISLAEQLYPVQKEINSLCIRIQQSMHLLSVPLVFIQAGSKVAPSHIRNQPGTIIHYNGQPPVVYTPQAVHPEVFNHLDRLYQRAYEISGISELSATGKKPAGLESGAALRIYHDIETERFILIGRRYESAFMSAAEHYFDLAEEIVAEQGSFPVQTTYRREMTKVDFEKIRMARDEFILEPFPVSILPSLPAGKLQTVQELINIGVIDKKEQITRLLDFPDLNSVSQVYEAAEADVEWRISKILDEGEYVGPEPYMDLNLAKQRFQLAYLEARQKGVEPEKIALLDEFIVQCQTMLNQLQTPPQGLPESPAVASPAGEAPAPTELMPELPETPETPESPLPI